MGSDFSEDNWSCVGDLASPCSCVFGALPVPSLVTDLSMSYKG